LDLEILSLNSLVEEKDFFYDTLFGKGRVEILLKGN
jgi:hypothetical protein